MKTTIALLVAALGCSAPSGVDLAVVAAPVTNPQASYDQVREAWAWLVPAQDEAVMITAIGDVLLRSPDGSYKFLDTQFGTLHRIGELPSDWQRAIARHDERDRWFHPEFVARLRAVHGPLKPEMVYSPTAPPSLSGEQTTENYTPRLAEMHLWYDGQLQRQVKTLPPGTVITKITTPDL